jgi:hypothetical protein
VTSSLVSETLGPFEADTRVYGEPDGTADDEAFTRPFP